MEKRRKTKNQMPDKPVSPVRKFKTWLALLSVAITPMIIGTSFAADASNGLLPGAAVKSDSDRLEQRLADSAAATAPGVMPEKAKAAKNRQEANAVVRPLVSSNSAITYDPWGRMAKIVDPGPVTRQFVYSGSRLCEERDGGGAVTKQFFQWGEIIGGTKYFYTRNHEGSVTEMTDSSGNVIAQYQYDPFGNVTRIAGSGPDSDFLYAGYFYHQPSGLYITAHRLYNPKLGRWLNRDPIDDPSFAMLSQNPEDTAAPENESAPGVPLNSSFLTFLNSHAHLAPLQATRGVPGVSTPYTYANNNPISKIDPSGLKAEDLGPTPCPQCTNDCDAHPANCRLGRRWSEQQQQWLPTIYFQQPGTPSKPGKTCTAYGYNGWPDTKNGYCTWLCN